MIRLGSGTDHTAFLVNANLVVRLGPSDAALLTAVAEWSTLDVPVVVAAGPDIVVYRYLPGVPLLAHPGPVTHLAPVLGRFLSRLHQAPALAPPDVVSPADWHAEAARTFRTLAASLSAWHCRLIEDFLAAPLPASSEAMVFCHNDLGAEHILIDPESHRITGVIDWSDAAMTDPAQDFARLYRDLGPEFFTALVSYYDGDPPDRERVRFLAGCLALEDIAFGGVHASTALANLPRTLGLNDPGTQAAILQ